MPLCDRYLCRLSHDSNTIYCRDDSEGEDYTSETGGQQLIYEQVRVVFVLLFSHNNQGAEN